MQPIPEVGGVLHRRSRTKIHFKHQIIETDRVTVSIRGSSKYHKYTSYIKEPLLSAVRIFNRVHASASKGKHALRGPNTDASFQRTAQLIPLTEL